MIGAGAIGRGVASQIVNRTQGMVLAVVANRTVANAVRALELSGVSEWKVVTTGVRALPRPLVQCGTCRRR